MSRTGTLILLGILIILAPFSGFPMAIRSILLVLFGVSVLGIGLSLRMKDVRAVESVAPAPAPAPSVNPESAPSHDLSVG